MSNKYILGCDPGLANFGVSIVDTDLNLQYFNNIRTIKGKSRLAAENIFLRGQEIARTLIKLMDEYDIVLTCAEAMSYPRSSDAAAKMTLTWGLICFVTEYFKIPLIMESPQMIKDIIAGAKNASKQDVRVALEEMGYEFPELPRQADYEHPIDALAAIVACKDRQIFRAIVGR